VHLGKMLIAADFTDWMISQIVFNVQMDSECNIRTLRALRLRASTMLRIVSVRGTEFLDE
ncbi:MAG: hypothetical protein II879_12030, partial [Clostridia bacterium]|nr:hypothetical protein [Clostridia bacterium]